ncbi:MAG: YceI family protein [Erythrobacter sp.]
MKAAFAPLLALSIALSACDTPNPAEPVTLTEGAWQVDPSASKLSYVSVKSGEIAEVNAFERVSGTVSPEGEAVIVIDLASVSTGVDIRDERMRDVFFDVARNPQATVRAAIDPAAFEALGVGQSVEQTLGGTLALRGIEAPFEAEVAVTRTAEDRVMAVSTRPVIVTADALELTDGLAQLQELAGLPSITPMVPVTFTLVFER